MPEAEAVQTARLDVWELVWPVVNKPLWLRLGQFNAKALISTLGVLAVEAGLSENTRLAYGRDLVAFVRYCKSQGVSSTAVITIFGWKRYSGTDLIKEY